MRIYVCMQPTDMRKGFDSLAALVRDWLNGDPLSGHLFVFRSRRGDRVKLLWWDKDGLVQYYKRLEEGVFRFPAAVDAETRSLEVSAGIVAGAVGHRPGQREATETVSTRGLKCTGKSFASTGIKRRQRRSNKA